MPSTAPPIHPRAAQNIGALGQQIRTRRKELRVSATAAAEAAGLSRVTLHRIEAGEASVTLGAYLNVMAALGLDVAVVQKTTASGPMADTKQAAGPLPQAHEGWIPARIRLADYPELRRLAWHVRGVDELTPAEAFGIYDRHGRHLNMQGMLAHERHLLDGLRVAFATGRGDV